MGAGRHEDVTIDARSARVEGIFVLGEGEQRASRVYYKSRGRGDAIRETDKVRVACAGRGEVLTGIGAARGDLEVEGRG